MKNFTSGQRIVRKHRIFSSARPIIGLQREAHHLELRRIAATTKRDYFADARLRRGYSHLPLPESAAPYLEIPCRRVCESASQPRWIEGWRDELVPVMRDGLLRRLFAILNGTEPQPDFAKIPVGDRQAISEILRETMPEAWKDMAKSGRSRVHARFDRVQI